MGVADRTSRVSVRLPVNRAAHIPLPMIKAIALMFSPNDSPSRSLRRTCVGLFFVALMASASAARPSSVRAQDRDELQLWAALLSTAHTAPAPPRMSFWLDVHLRRGGAGTVHILRPGIGVTIFDWLTLWAGYAWVPTFDDASRGNPTHEHRIWEQATLTYRAAEIGLLLQSRTRFEQRLHETGGDVGFRLRQFVRANWQPVADVPVGVAFWDELFIGLNETAWGAPSGIDQNRAFLGPFVALASWARLEAGYLFAYLDRGVSDLYAHVVAVNVFLSYAPPAEPTPGP